MKKILLVLLAVCAAGTPAAAQPSAERLALAAELLEATEQRQIFESSMEIMLTAQIQADPDLRQFEDVLRAWVARYTNWNAVKDEFARIYAERFTADEMREIIAFHRTPVGAKLVRETPAIMQEAEAVGARIAEANQGELERMLIEQMERKRQ